MPGRRFIYGSRSPWRAVWRSKGLLDVHDVFPCCPVPSMGRGHPGGPDAGTRQSTERVRARWFESTDSHEDEMLGSSLADHRSGAKPTTVTSFPFQGNPITPSGA